MKQLIAVGAVVGAVVVLLGGCTRAIYNPHVDFSARSPVIVKGAILQALAAKQWLAQEEGPNVIRGTRSMESNTGLHQAMVRIQWSEDSYSIHYLWSDGLAYQTRLWGGEQIHSTYNLWVTELSRDINTLLGMPPERECKAIFCPS